MKYLTLLNDNILNFKRTYQLTTLRLNAMLNLSSVVFSAVHEVGREQKYLHTIHEHALSQVLTEFNCSC